MSPSARAVATRFRGVLIFVALVWSVAASFIAFDLVALWSMDLAVAYPRVFGDIGVAHAARASTICAPPASHAADTASPFSPAQARAGAWSLGLRVGWDTQARQSMTVTPETRASSRASIEQLATMLAIPAPAAFTPVRLGLANSEFIDTLEADAQSTARTLASRYSSQACRAFKLGTVWGQVAMARPSLPGERPPFASELRYYAQQAGVPMALWHPMVEPPSAHASADAIFSESQTLTQQVTTYLLAP